MAASQPRTPPSSSLRPCPALAPPHSKLGCTEGRSSQRWVDFDFFGHQIVAHLVEGYQAARTHNHVDGDAVPVPHFGLALSLQQFDALACRCRQRGVRFVIEPHLRFQGRAAPPCLQLDLALTPKRQERLPAP